MTVEQAEFVASVKFIRQSELETKTIYLRGRFEFLGGRKSDAVCQRSLAAQRPIAADPIPSDPDTRAPLGAEPPGRNQRSGDRGGLGRTGAAAHAGNSIGEDGGWRAGDLLLCKRLQPAS